MHNLTLPLQLTAAFALSLLISCSSDGDKHYHPVFTTPAGNKHEIIFGVPALSYFETTGQLVKYLNARLDSFTIRAVACNSVDDYEDKLKKGYFDFTAINGVQLLAAERNGYIVVGRIADDYRSFIFVNKDSAIGDFRDCKGKTIALTGNRILAGSIQPLMFLHEHGIRQRDLDPVYCPSFESVLLNVCLGKCAMGAVWSTAFFNFQNTRPDLASHLQLKWATPALPSSAVLFKRTLDKQVAQKLAGLLFGLQANQQGRQALKRVGIGGLTPADSNTYIPLKEFIRKFDSLND